MSLPNYVKFSKTETIVSLAEDRGVLKTNSFGEYFHRTFTDGRFCCAAPDLERKLIDMGVRAGATVGIACQKYGQSNVWNVRIVEAAPGPQAVARRTWPNHPVRRDLPPEKYAAVPPNAAPDLTQQLQASIEHVDALKKPAAAAPANGYSNGHTPATDSQLNLMARCGCAAVDAALAVQAYAATKGLPLKFNEQSISAWSSTMYIKSEER